MELEMARCPVCGKSFHKKMSRQKYCSPACGRYANRHNKVMHEEVPDAEVIRTFTCRRCGELVKVTDPMDKRLKFCSQHCEKLFWKHPEKAEALVVERTFVCRGCGKIVKVTDAFDRRHTFCSKKCQQQYVIRMLKKTRAEKKAEKEKETPKEHVRRSFVCRECGKVVKITKNTDHRYIYCSDKCRKRGILRAAKRRNAEKKKK